MSRTRSVLKSILLVLLCVLIVAGAAVAAYLYADRRQEIFGGRAEILYEGGEVSLTSEAERQIATQRALLMSASTLGPIAERFGLAADDLDEHVSVESVDDSNVLRLTVDDADPELAVAVAQAVAESYVAQVRGAESPELEEAKGLIESRIEELAAQLPDLQKRFGKAKRQGCGEAVDRRGQPAARRDPVAARPDWQPPGSADRARAATDHRCARANPDAGLSPRRAARTAARCARVPGARSPGSLSPVSPCLSSGASVGLHERPAGGARAQRLDRRRREPRRRRKLTHGRRLDDHQPCHRARPGGGDRRRARTDVPRQHVPGDEPRSVPRLRAPDRLATRRANRSADHPPSGRRRPRAGRGGSQAGSSA